MGKGRVPSENYCLIPSQWELSHLPRLTFILRQCWETAIAVHCKWLENLRTWILVGVCDKVARDLGLGGGFRRVRISFTTYKLQRTICGRKGDESQNYKKKTDSGENRWIAQCPTCYISGNLTALMDVWSKVLPLTACCLSPISRFESHLGHLRKLPVTWDKA